MQGEEFLIIMPNTKLDYAHIYAERLRQEVQDYDFNEMFKRLDD
jgi:PleD family two-component response regulator